MRASELYEAVRARWSAKITSHRSPFRPAPRTEIPALPVVPGDLDTLRAQALAADDGRSASLLVGTRDGPSQGMKEPITVPSKEKNDADQQRPAQLHRQDHRQRPR